MADFKLAKAKTLKWEGGYSNHPNDGGGETICGVARKEWGSSPLCTGIWRELDNYKKANPDNPKLVGKLLEGNATFQAELEKFYKTQFWNVIRGDEIEDQATANALFDFAVNSGVIRASKYIQRLAGAVDDGKIGPKSIESINAAGADLCNKLCDERKAFLEGLAEKKPSQKVFLKGWMNRVNDFRV